MTSDLMSRFINIHVDATKKLPDVMRHALHILISRSSCSCLFPAPVCFLLLCLLVSHQSVSCSYLY